MVTPFLVGKNVYLRGLLEADFHSGGAYFQWFNDQEVCRGNSHGRFPNSEGKMADYFRHLQSESDLVLAICTKQDQRHIGNISLQKINWIDRCAEFAILVGEKDCWGKGYSREAGALLLRHGFESLNLNRIYCGTLEDNEGMQALAKGLGMQQEGRRRRGVFKNGKFLDIFEYGLLREEFHLGVGK